MNRIALALSLLLAQNVFASTHTVDASHSNVTFQIRHLVSKVTGNFKEFEGEFNFDEKAIDKTTATFSVKTASIDTNSAKRDEHLRSPDFFDVQKFDKMTFKSTVIKKGGAKKFKMTGDLTLHGVTKAVTFDVEYNGASVDPWGNQRRGFTATSQINRKDFGIVWNKNLDAGGVMLGDDVKISIEIEGVEKKEEKK